LCAVCYGKRLRTAEEAKVRLGAGESGYEWSGGGYSSSFSSRKTFDRKNSSRKQWSSNGGSSNKYYKGGKKVVGRRDDDDEKDGRNIQGISTSSLFDVPKGYNTAVVEGSSSSVSNAESKQSIMEINSRPNNLSNRRVASSDERSRTRTRAPRRTSREPGGMELAKRMQQQQGQQPTPPSEEESNGNGAEPRASRRTDGSTKGQKSERAAVKSQRMEGTSVKLINQEATMSTTIGKLEAQVGGYAGRSDPSSSNSKDDQVSNVNVDNEKQSTERNNSEQWVKVEDPGSNRMFYWNTETGEMRKTI